MRALHFDRQSSAHLVSLTLLASSVGCSSELGPSDRPDGGFDVGLAPDADVRMSDPDGATGTDAPIAVDAPGADAALPSVDAPLPSDGGPACTPTHTSCRGELECGAVPNGCPGGSIDCGLCGGGETWCAVLPSPPWLSRVRSCVPSVIAAHPEYFDATMSCSPDSPLVLDARAAEYVLDVAACVNGSGAVAIVDPNAPVNEIRVRGETNDIADNYPVRVYATGCTRQAYTSSCTPAFF